MADQQNKLLDEYDDEDDFAFGPEQEEEYITEISPSRDIPNSKYPIEGSIEWKEWQANNELVMRLYCQDGLTKGQIIKQSKLPPRVVDAIVRRLKLRQQTEALRQEITEEILREKVPLLKNITSINLMSILDWSIELRTSEKYKKMSIQDAAGLMKLSKDAFEMSRLEEGKSTQNFGIAHRVEKELATVLQDLRTIDPFVDYPQIEHKKEEGEQ